MNILGIGGVLGDAAAAIIKDGQIAAAVEETKLIRRPQPGRLPENAVATCLRIAGISPADVDYVALARPLPPGSALPIALRMFPKARIVSIDHHAAHAAAAYFPSPFRSAVVITLDREGDLRCGTKWRGEGNRLVLEEEILYPDSIGELYGRVTELLGFQPQADEHRVQWLSATGEPRYLEVFRKVVRNHAIDRSYFESGERGNGGFGARFFEQLGIGGRSELTPTQRADIASSMQKTLEEYVLDLAGNVWEWCLNEYEKPDRTKPGGSESRVLRGGSWRYDREFARAGYRDYDPPHLRGSGFGFRVVVWSPIGNAANRGADR